MTNPNARAEQSPAHDYTKTVFDHLIEQQAHDPQFTGRLAKQLWEALPPDDREIRYNMAAAFYPEEDIVGRQNLISSQLLLDYLTKEAGLAYDLDRQFAIISPTNPETIT